MKKTILFLLVLCYMNLGAQISYKGSTTIEHIFPGERDLILGMQENGCAVLFHPGKEKNLRLRHYDPYLNLVREIPMKISAQSFVVGREYTGNKLYLVFRTGIKQGNFVEYDPVTGAVKNLEFPLKAFFSLYRLHVLGKFAYLDGFLYPRHKVLQLDMGTGLLSEVQSDETIAMNELQPLGPQQMAVFSLRYSDSIPQLHFSIYDHVGNKTLEDLPIPSDHGKYPFTARMTLDADSVIVIAGQYKRKGKSGSQGLYFMRYQKGRFTDQSFYSFDDFDHLYAYLPTDERKAEGEKTRKQKEAGREDFYNLQLLENKLLKTPQGYVLVTEHFQTTVNYEPVDLPINDKGKPKVKLSLVPSEYTGQKIINLMAVSFGPHGEKLWDQTTALPKEYNYSSEMLTQTAVQDDQSHIILLWGDALYDMAISGSGDIQYWEKTAEPDPKTDQHRTEGFFSQFVLLPDGKVVIMGHKKQIDVIKHLVHEKDILALQLFYVL